MHGRGTAPQERVLEVENWRGGHLYGAAARYGPASVEKGVEALFSGLNRVCRQFRRIRVTAGRGGAVRLLQREHHGPGRDGAHQSCPRALLERAGDGKLTVSPAA